jgi:hypothetical protein
MTDRELIERLRATTEAMANLCSVDMILWDRHSNACLQAADRLSALSAERDAVIEECAKVEPTSKSDVEREMEKAMEPDHSRTGMFVYHNCWRCNDGKNPCFMGNPNGCTYPQARND